MKKKATKSSKVSKVGKTKGAIKPLGDRVLVKPFTLEELREKTSFGLIIPDSVSKERSAQGKVVAVGPGRREEGKLVPLSVKKGDLVIFSKYGYDEVEHEGEEYYLLKEDNLLAVIE